MLKEVEEPLLRVWKEHRKVHADATQAVRRSSRSVTDEIDAAHRAGMSPERIAAVLKVGIGAVLHRLRDAERTLAE